MIKWVDGQAYANYLDWECRAAGMWEGDDCLHIRHEASAALLSSLSFFDAMRSVVLIWPISTAIHLTNQSINRRAWLGQAACYLELGNCIGCTSKAWSEMSYSETKYANILAEQMIIQWNQTNTKNAIFRRQSDQLGLVF